MPASTARSLGGDSELAPLPQQGGGHDADQHGGDELAAHGHDQHGHGDREEGGWVATLDHRRHHEGDEDGAGQVTEKGLDTGV